MSSTIQIELPEYFMVKHYKTLNRFTSLDEIEQMINTISAITEQSPDSIKTWSIPSVVKVYNGIQELIKGVKPEFYPIVEWNGELWGFRNMSKMSLGEYIDLDMLTKEYEKNINQILALLYRPITKNKLTTANFMVKSTLKALKYDVENVFEYYEIEEYDPSIRQQRAELFDNFPVEIALGSMAFFLDTATMLSSDSQLSSHQTQMKEIQTKMSMMKKNKQRLLNTTAGFIHSKKLATPPSYQSPVINQLQTSM